MEMKGKLVCATEFTPDELSAITEKFDKLFDAKIDFDVTVDSSLLNGFVVTVNNMVYDLSAKSYLDRMQEYMDGDDTKDEKTAEDMAVSLKRSVDGTFGDDAIGRNLAARITQFDVKYDIAMIGIVERT